MGFIIGICLTQIFNAISKTSSLYELVGFFGLILIGALSVILLFLYIEYYYNNRSNSSLNMIPNDIITPFIRQTIVFDDVSYKNEDCSTETYRELQNYMPNHKYDSLKVEISSHVHVPEIDDIKIILDGKPQKGNEFCFNNDLCHKTSINAMSETPLQMRIFDIPLYLKPKKSCRLSYSYRSFSYRPALNGKDDYTQIKIARLTKKLTIEIILEGLMKEKYYLSKCNPQSEEGGSLEYRIFDGSDHRMFLEEQNIHNKKSEPVYYDDRFIWEIKYPKLCYKYRLYFTIKPKEKM